MSFEGSLTRVPPPAVAADGDEWDDPDVEDPDDGPQDEDPDDDGDSKDDDTA